MTETADHFNRTGQLLAATEGSFAVVLVPDRESLDPAFSLVRSLMRDKYCRRAGQLVISRNVTRSGVDLSAWERENQAAKFGIGIHLIDEEPIANLDEEERRLRLEGTALLTDLSNGLAAARLARQALNL